MTDHHRLEQEIAAVQRRLLPDYLPVVPGYEFAVHYAPSQAAGGDYFGFQRFDEHRIGFAIADVSGHGVQAAVMMAVLRTALSAFRVFGRMRQGVPQDINAIWNDVQVPGIFVTAIFAVLDASSGTIHAGNCGHPPARRVRRDGTVERVMCDSSPPIGVIETLDPPELSVQLAPGESLVLFTDGITEARNAAGEMFDDHRLDRAISEGAGGPERIVQSIVQSLAEHDRGLPQSDDRCILVCRRANGDA